jgi:hypothetical protein
MRSADTSRDFRRNPRAPQALVMLALNRFYNGEDVQRELLIHAARLE